MALPVSPALTVYVVTVFDDGDAAAADGLDCVDELGDAERCGLGICGC